MLKGLLNGVWYTLVVLAVTFLALRSYLAPHIERVMNHRNTKVEQAFAAKLQRMQKEQWHDRFDPNMLVDCSSPAPECALDVVFNASKPVYRTIDRVSKLSHERFLKVCVYVLSCVVDFALFCIHLLRFLVSLFVCQLCRF